MRGNCRYGHFKILDFSVNFGILKISIFLYLLTVINSRDPGNIISMNGDTQL